MLETDEFYTATEVGLEDLNPYLYINTYGASNEDGTDFLEDKVLAVLTVKEEFEFHRNLDRELGDSSNQLFNLDGRPTEAVLSVLRKLVEERYNGIEFGLDDEDGSEFFEFELTAVVDRDTTPEALGLIFWESTKLVQFYNEVDPGTFGSPYLFGSLMYDGLEKLDR
jgi:hypothetical protein